MITYVLKCNRCYIPETIAKFKAIRQAQDYGWYVNDEGDCLCPNCVKELEEEECERIETELAFWNNL